MTELTAERISSLWSLMTSRVMPLFSLFSCSIVAMTESATSTVEALCRLVIERLTVGLPLYRLTEVASWVP